MPVKGSKIETPYRKHGEGSVKQRPNGLWVARVHRIIDGKRVPIQFTGMDFDTVMEKFDGAKRDLRQFGHVADPSITVTEWTERWLNEVIKQSVRPDTWSSYASLMRKWVQKAIGDKKLGEVKPADIRQIRTFMLIPDKDTGKVTSTSTILKAYRVFSKCLEDARRDNLVTENVATKVDPPRKAVSRRGSFTAGQVKDILKAAADSADSRTIFTLLTGTRQSEGLGLELGYLDLEGGSAEIAWQLQEIPWDHRCGSRGQGGVFPCGFKQAAKCPVKVRRVPDGYDYRMLEGNFALVPTKSSGSHRSVPLLPPVTAAIRIHLEANAAAPNPHGLIWRQPDGSPIPHKVDAARWHELTGAVGLPKECTMHWARHSVATLLLEAGVDAKIVGEIFGHGSVAVTRGVYQHVSSALAREAMGKLGELLA